MGIALDAVPLVIFQPLRQKISLTGSALLRRRECVGQRPIWSRLPPKKLGFPPRNSLDRARPSVTRASCSTAPAAPTAASADRRCARSGISSAGPAKDCLCALSTSSFPQKVVRLASVFLGAAPAAFQSRTVNFLGPSVGPRSIPLGSSARFINSLLLGSHCSPRSCRHILYHSASAKKLTKNGQTF